MSHVHIVGVECPDCGQIFVDANQHQHPNTDDEEYPIEGEATFKKPTMISRVVSRIFNPFSSPSAQQTSPGAPARSTISSLRSRRVHGDHLDRDSRTGSEINYYKRKREADEVSQTGTVFTRSSRDFYEYPYQVRKQRRAIENTPSYRPHSSSYSTLTTPSQFHRNPQEVHFYRPNLQVRLELDHGDTRSVSDESDRLNLKRYVQPQLSPICAVKAWLDEHQDCDPVDSLLTQDLSCDCKNGKNAEKDKVFQDFLGEMAESVQRIQKALEEVAGPGPSGINTDKKHGKSAGAGERLKSVIDECSKTRLRIVDFLEYRKL